MAATLKTAEEPILFDEASPRKGRRDSSCNAPLFKSSAFSIDARGRLLDRAGLDSTRADANTLLLLFKISHVGDQRGPERAIEMFRFSGTGLLRVTWRGDVFWMLERKASR